ncbi:MAG: YigZ family protein [Oscillospiraceae bacterium]
MKNEDYLVPAGAAESEFIEKRSRFIGQLWRVEDEPEARARIEEVKKQYHDARHHCWCYLLRDGVLRYSDDGEPQGTAGLPMLEVLRREGIQNVCCVVTRYFGGILLGAGGLTRAYARSAKDALDAAGICRMARWTLWEIPCDYPLFQRVKLEIAAADGITEGVDYGEGLLLHAAFPAGGAERFSLRLTELSAGRFAAVPCGETFRATAL